MVYSNFIISIETYRLHSKPNYYLLSPLLQYFTYFLMFTDFFCLLFRIPNTTPHQPMAHSHTVHNKNLSNWLQISCTFFYITAIESLLLGSLKEQLEELKEELASLILFNIFFSSCCILIQRCPGMTSKPSALKLRTLNTYKKSRIRPISNCFFKRP